MNCNEVAARIEQEIPLAYAEPWDNVGLLVGSKTKEVSTIMLAVDATDEVIRQSVMAQADMLITHHPLIFSGCKRISDDHFIGKRIIRLIQADIAYYAMHTNFDVARMADIVADKLGLINRQVLEVTGEKEGEAIGIGTSGEFSGEMTLRECAKKVKEIFALESVKVFGDPERTIKTASTCPGSGKSVLGNALSQGADVFITGDIDHHTGIDAVAQGLSVIDAGHYGLEKVFVPYMEAYLKEKCPKLQVISAKEENPFWTT